MYNDEERTSFSIRNVILQILFVLLFVFLLMWLFPTKSTLNGKIQPFYDRIFNENVMIMKDAAKSYFTLERLPQNVGDKVTLTLGEMLDEKLLLSFKDSNNNKCDENKSYVEVTKMDNEYIMKVYLSCSDNEDYILVHMGCYDYCSTTICEDENEIANNKRPAITIPVVPDPTPVEDTKNYKCEYLKVTNGYYTDWSNWSGWSTDIAYGNELKQVTSKVETSTQDVQKYLGDIVTTYVDKSKPIYEDVQVQTGTQIQTVCIEEGIEYVPTGEYTYSYSWTSQGTQRYSTAMSDTATEKYKLVGTGHDDGCGECNNGLYYLYEVSTYSETKTAIMKENTVCIKTQDNEVPLYTIEKKWTGKYETGTIRTPVYQTVSETTSITYYRYRTRSLISGSEDRKWSNCEDHSLLDNGYSIVQKVEE